MHSVHLLNGAPHRRAPGCSRKRYPRGSFLTEHLQHELQGFLRLAQLRAATSRFLELGMDSLMAVELRNRLLGQFGSAFTITASAVVDYPTIGSLAEYLAGQVPELVEVESVGAPEPTQ